MVIPDVHYVLWWSCIFSHLACPCRCLRHVIAMAFRALLRRFAFGASKGLYVSASSPNLRLLPWLAFVGAHCLGFYFTEALALCFAMSLVGRCLAPQYIALGLLINLLP